MNLEIAAVGLFLLAGAGLAQNQSAPAAGECARLTTFRIPTIAMEITRTEWIAAAAMPAHCRVEGVVNRRTGVGGKEYGIGFAIALPEQWNRDLLLVGGGGLNGSIPSLSGGAAAGNTPGLARGFAVAGSDSGHKGTGTFDGSFMADQQASLDFAYQALGRVTEAAKLIVAQYYSRPPAYSYFTGCSTGGREAMILTQRYPTYFDGVVAGDPAIRTGFSNLADRWAAVSLHGVALPESDKKLVIDGLLARCDSRDGIQDGMIFDTAGCDFNPAQLQCEGAKSESCLTGQQVEAIQRAFAGPKDSRGVQVYPGFPFDTGINAKTGIPGLLAPGPSPVGPRTPPTEQNVDREAVAAANPLTDALSTNLSSFSGHGGKLLFYHGLSDPWFSPLDTLEYFQNMSKANGGMQKAADWSRLYLVPGMGHCGGGEATLDRFDMLGAVVDWVEKGIAPDSVPATGKAFPDRSRPLCAYPKHAQYQGHGNSEDARNFECKE